MTIALLQPIEITDDNKDLTVTVGMVGPALLTLTTGTYGCLLSLLNDIQAKLTAAFAPNAPTVVLSSTHRVSFHSALDLTITWTDVDLGRLLGWRADVGITAGPCIVAGEDTPQRCWFPGFVASERHRWRRDHGRAFSGTQAHDGTLAGVEVGPAVYRQRLVWEDVFAPSALVTGQSVSYIWGANTYYPEEERAWETFFHSVRASTTVDDAATGTTGVYYLPEVGVWETDDPVGDPVVYPATLDSGGIRHGLALLPDTYIFAHTTPTPPQEPTESLDGSVWYYRVELDLLTAPAPAWSAE